MAIPTLAVADGGALRAAGGAVAGPSSAINAAVGGVAGGVIGERPLDPGVSSSPCRDAVLRHPDHDYDKQQYRRERHETDDQLLIETTASPIRILNP